MIIRTFQIDDTENVVALWHAAGLTRPWNDPYADINGPSSPTITHGFG